MRRTWAPRGCTPALIHNVNWNRVSTIGVLVCSPAGRRVQLRLSVRPGSIKSADIVTFLKALRREFRRRQIVLIWDRLPGHRSRETRAYLDTASTEGWLHVEWFPPYAPELNPVEYVWGHLDNGLMANYAPPTVEEIAGRVRKGACQMRHRPPLLRSFLKASKLFF